MKFGILFIVLFGWIGFFVGKLFSALIVALLALIVRAVIKVTASFGTLYKISIYALTAPVIVEFFVKLVGISIPFYFWLFHGGALVFAYFGLKAIKEEQEEAGTLPPASPENNLPGDTGGAI